jgi:hypothetical protein
LKVEFEDGRPTLSYRSHEQWASYARVLVTQPGFAWGSSVPGGGADGNDATTEARAVAEGRLPTLATIYASFVSADEIRRILLSQGPVRGVVTAQALPAGPNGGAILPIVAITAISDTPQGSQSLGDRTVEALRQYITRQQLANRVPPAERIELRPLNRAGMTELIAPRSKTLALVVFMAVLLATVGLALVLENVSPKQRPVAVADQDGLGAPDRAHRAAS